MDFSIFTTTLIDIGVFSIGGISISLICLWQLRKQAAKYQLQRDESERRYTVLQEQHDESERRYTVLQERYNALQEEFSSFQSAADRRYNALQKEHEILKEENATLRSAVDALTTEQKALQSAHDRLSGRHAELVERVMPVFEILAREKLMEINARNET